MRREIVLIALASLFAGLSAGSEAEANSLGYLDLHFSGAGGGSGYLRYDPLSLAPFYEYRDAWIACQASSDPDACRELSQYLLVPLRVTDARLQVSGTLFDTPDFQWTFMVDGQSGRDFASISIDNGPSYIWSECASNRHLITDSGLYNDCGAFEFLNFRINGVYGDDSNGRLYWAEAAMPASEPGSLALLWLGLVGVGLSRFKRRAARSIQ